MGVVSVGPSRGVGCGRCALGSQAHPALHAARPQHPDRAVHAAAVHAATGDGGAVRAASCLCGHDAGPCGAQRASGADPGPLRCALGPRMVRPDVEMTNETVPLRCVECRCVCVCIDHTA